MAVMIDLSSFQEFDSDRAFI